MSEQQPLPKTVARERVIIDGVAYKIRVTANDHGHRGAWTCTECGLKGQSALDLAGEAAALCWAKDSLAVHHAAVHAVEADPA